jgi:ribonuclease P protein component
MAPSLKHPPEARVRLASDYRRVRAARRTVSDDVLEIRWARGEGATARLGTIVPIKKLGAVGRNRVKRVLREVFRLRRASLPPGLDLVASPRDLVKARKFAAVAASFDALLLRIAARDRR